MWWERWIPKSYLTKNAICGVECVFDEAGITFNYAVLQIKKNKVEISEQGTSTDALEILKIAKKQSAPISLAISGKGVIVKKIIFSENDSLQLKDLLQQHLPAIPFNEFYVQFYKNAENSGNISVCRKEQVNELISQFTKDKTEVVNVFIGPLICNALSSITSNYNRLSSSVNQLELVSGFVESVQPNTNNSGFTQIPLSISSLSYVATFGGPPSGSYNTFNNCNMYNGSHKCVYLGGPSTPPYSTGNSILNSNIIDWSNLGVETHFQKDLNVNYCSVSRPTRTLQTVGTGIYFYDPVGGTKCIGNCISNFLGGTPQSTVAVQAIVFSGTSAGLAANTISANLIHNLGGNKSTSGIVLFNFNGSVANNSVILNNTSSTYSSLIAAISTCTNSAVDTLKILNNYISISQGGTGGKYGIMTNNYVLNSNINQNRFYYPSGTTNTFYGTTASGSANTFANWQALGCDLAGTNYTSNPNIVLTSNCGNGAIPPPICDFILPSANKCIGSTLTFSDSSSNSPNSWSWSVSPQTSVMITSSTSQNPQFTFAAAGLYSITSAASNAGGPGTAITKTININPLPSIQINASSNTLCLNAALSLTASGGISYLWNNGSQSATILVTPQTNTVYTVTGTDANGCSKTNSVSIVIISCTQISENAKPFDAFKIYPNPFSENIHVKLPDDGIYFLNIYDGLGKLIVNAKCDQQSQIHLSNIHPGIYYMSIVDANQQIIYHQLIQKVD